MLKYNTLYQSLKKVSGEWHAGSVLWHYQWYYLKFFSNGKFIYAAIAGDEVKDINSWFVEGAGNTLQGTYVRNNNLQLTLKFENGGEFKAGLTEDGQIVVDGLNSWEIYKPLI